MEQRDIKLIIDLLQENRSDIKHILITQTKMQCDVCRNADDLQEHMRRTELLETNQDQFEKRITALEEPGKIKRYLINKYTTAIAAIGALLGVIFYFLRIFWQSAN